MHHNHPTPGNERPGRRPAPGVKEIAMKRIHHMRLIRLFAIMLAALAGAVLAFSAAATPALATLPPPDPGGTTVVPPPSTHTIVTGGMPGWQITLIAVGAALLAAVLAVIVDRMRPARRRVTTRAA